MLLFHKDRTYNTEISPKDLRDTRVRKGCSSCNDLKGHRRSSTIVTIDMVTMSGMNQVTYHQNVCLIQKSATGLIVTLTFDL